MPLDAVAPAADAALVWGSVPLPEGTRLWMRFANVEHEAVVSDGVVVYEGASYSPNGFALAVTRRPTNAWSCVWIRRPDDADFVLADDARAASRGEIRPARSRPAARRPAAPKRTVLSLVPFLVKSGGLRDPKGEVLSLLGGRKSTRPGLISDSGMALDRALQKAIESGYFPEAGSGRSGAEAESLVGKLASCGRDCETLTERDLLDAIDEELRGRLSWPDGLAPESAPDEGREEADRSALEDAAARWARLVEVAMAGGSAAVLDFVSAELGPLPVSEEIPF